MKIIHTADLHLDSALETNLGYKAKKRRQELISAFEKLVEYAKQEKVRLVLISGDIFDHNNATPRTFTRVADIISNAGDIDFLLLSGNHDSLNNFSQYEALPSNLKTFSDSWQYYSYENFCIAGINLNASNKSVMPTSLALDEDNYNIVMLHTEIESVKTALRDKNIDYLALGHIHKHDIGKIDNRATWAYSGCLEARGFDESGKKGFVLLDTEENRIEFIESSIRTMYEIEVDISDIESYTQIKNKVFDEIHNSGATSEDMVKLVLVGTYTLNTDKGIENLADQLEREYYFSKFKDKTKMKICIDDFKNSVSLKGEFVRSVYASDLSDEQKEKIMLLGIRAIEGEEI